jgi:hypothetical protein
VHAANPPGYRKDVSSGPLVYILALFIETFREMRLVDPATPPDCDGALVEPEPGRIPTRLMPRRYDVGHDHGETPTLRLRGLPAVAGGEPADFPVDDVYEGITLDPV